MKKLYRGLEKWGHYALGLLCAAVILLSALWTKSQPLPLPPDTQALSDQSQRLGRIAEEPTEKPLVRPVEGPVLRPWSEAPVYQAETGLWQSLPGMDFAADKGDAVRAVAAGVVQNCAEDVTIDHGGGLVSRYFNVSFRPLRAGQAVLAGDVIGQADGTGWVRVILLRDGESRDFGKDWVDNPSDLSYNELKQSLFLEN